MNSYTIWFGIFAILGYFIVTDQSAAKAFYMLTQLIRIQYEKTKWWITQNPRNPVVKYLMWRRSMKLAEELMRELTEKTKPED